MEQKISVGSHSTNTQPSCGRNGKCSTSKKYDGKIIVKLGDALYSKKYDILWRPIQRHT